MSPEEKKVARLTVLKEDLEKVKVLEALTMRELYRILDLRYVILVEMLELGKQRSVGLH